MKKFLLITLLSIFGGNWAFAQKQDTLRIRVMTYNLRFGELASLEQIAEHIKAFNRTLSLYKKLTVKPTVKEPPDRMEKISLQS